MKTKTLMINATIATIYVVITLALSFMSYGAVQFRVAEMLNYLVVFNKKYIPGIVAGVLISNLGSPIIQYDMIFGVGQSLISLVLAVMIIKYLNNTWLKMSVVLVLFALSSTLIAWELLLALEVPFWAGYTSVVIGEVTVLLVGMPIMKNLDKVLHFSDRIEGKGVFA
ncbi:QueT transporter family protein [Carnobacterium gallinarum]|uniref:QueT transporter family protein n=1 Tax=Carnobacterium gallinarum TaxID=2749 RepID=UPI0005556FB7|nr:QueT transporter family protein [Carnobacterium gallinarum]